MTALFVQLKLYAHHRLHAEVYVAELIVPLLAYNEASFTVVPFSPSAAILSKLYIATKPESYKL